MTTKEKIEDLESVIDNLLIQNGLAIAKQGALTQMVLGVYRETLEKEKYQNIAIRFIEMWEKFALDAIDALDVVVSDSDIIRRQKLEVLSNVQHMKIELLS
jgi:hypothetical protein